MRCEMFGKAHLHIKMIVDQHTITTEILQGFQPVFTSLLSSGYDFDKITRDKNFKPILKELNAKTNGIFS